MACAASRRCPRRRLLLSLPLLAAAHWVAFEAFVLLGRASPWRGLAARVGAGQQPAVARPAAASAQSDGDSAGELPRRLALGAAVAAVALLANRKLLVEGNMSQYDPAPGSLKGRRILITGGNTGLGRESAIRLAKAGATVVITARTDQKGQAAVEAIRKASGSSDVSYLKLDLADLASVRAFVETYKQQPYGDRVDVIMNNAGVMAIPEQKFTKDGFEQQFGVNHLGHFALTGLMLPLLRRADGGGRVINVSSIGHFGATRELMEDAVDAPEKYTQWGAYSQSKLANVLFAKELDRRLKAKGVDAIAVSCHPGGVDTDLTRWVYAGNDSAVEGKQKREENAVANGLYNYLSRSVELGANTQVYLAAEGAGVVSRSGGAYFDNMAEAPINSAADDVDLAKKLWTASERLTGVKFDL